MREIMDKLGKKLAHKKILYYILNFTWGILLTLLGYFLMLILLPFGKVKRFNYVLYLTFNRRTGWGFAMGAVFFVGKDYNTFMLNHEYGHTVQNAILGPFMIFLVAIPSAIRFWYRNFLRSIKINPKTFYDDIWFEGNATYIGDTYYIEK